MSRWYFDPRIIPGIKSQVEIVLGRTLFGDEADSSGIGGDQTGVLSQRRNIGESRRIETITGRRGDSPESRRNRSRSMLRQRRVDGATGGTKRGSRGRGQRTTRRLEKTRVIS